MVIACNGQYSYKRKLVKYSYASGKVGTLTHCDNDMPILGALPVADCTGFNMICTHMSSMGYVTCAFCHTPITSREFMHMQILL